MAITVKHAKVSAVPDEGDASLIRPSDWNSDHTLLGLGTAAEKDSGVANGVASLDSGGTVPLSQLPASIKGGLVFKGTWNASTNTPTLVSSVGTANDYYVVSVAGSTNLNGVTTWAVNDLAIYNGSAWQKVSASNPTIITANSTDPALRVTQTGTGNAFVVEDSTTPDTTAFVIDNAGNVTTGGTLTVAGKLAVDQSDVGTAPNKIPLNQYLGNLAYQDAANIAGNVGVGGALTVQAGTAALPSITPTGDTNTGLFFPAADTIAFSEGGVEVMRITDAGNVGIGVTPNASALLDVQSTTKGVRMPNMTTTQKNAIASPAAGLIVFDTTLSKLSVYSGIAWQTITSV